MELRKFVVPEFLFGVGARQLAVRYALNFAARRILVVSDPGVVQAGWTGELITQLEEEGLPYSLFTGVTPNPRASEVMAGAEMYVQDECNLIIAVGGGSPMDCAKGIGIVTSNRRHIQELVGVDKVDSPGPPLICIPTTAGSSADLSQFAIITSADGVPRKNTIISKTVVPDVSLIDPMTTTTMDAKLTAGTGFDVFVHAIEAYASNANSPITDLHALAAIPLVMANLAASMADPDNLQARTGMMLAATHSGMAFSNASLGAVHAMAHSLGGYTDWAHGEINSILLRPVIAFNYPAVPERYREIARVMGISGPPEGIKDALLEKVAAFQHEIGLDHPLEGMDLSPRDRAQLVEMTLQDPSMVTNPRRPTQKEIEAIYGQAL